MKKGNIEIENLPNVNKRLYKFIINEFGSVYAFCKKTGLSQPRINSLFHISKKTNDYPTIQSDIIEVIAKESDLDLNWLMKGEGKMLKGSINSDISSMKIPQLPEVPTMQTNQKENNDAIEALMNVINVQKESLKFVTDSLIKQVEEERELRNNKLAELEKHVLFQNEQIKKLIAKLNERDEDRKAS